MAWHQRQVAAHLQHLTRVREHAGTPGQRLEAVLQAFALITHRHHDTDLAALLHRGEHVIQGQQQLHAFLQTLLAEGAQSGELRADIEPAELASYCLYALTAASSLPSLAAGQRLVSVTLAGLRPPP
ncbi:hypothetical protein [Deinococcus sp. QL22]|uniref:SbtR family transcriptional regulator n=1 Tax=Deinococcus sp. QL22 TaxID=2939437 RepID=UPI0035300401